MERSTRHSVTISESCAFAIDATPGPIISCVAIAPGVFEHVVTIDPNSMATHRCSDDVNDEN